MNSKLLMSGVEYFDDGQAINPFMDSSVKIDLALATQEHKAAQRGYEIAGMSVHKVAAPEKCQDGVYTANWAFILDDKAVMSRLPNARKGEEPYAKMVLDELGLTTVEAPDGLLFSGQGDMLFIPGTRTVIGGYGYRSDRKMHDFIAKKFDCEVISLHAIPQRSWFGKPSLRHGRPVTNPVSGLADSPAYDIDLAVGIIRGAGPDGQKPLIAYCPELLDKPSRKLLAARKDLELITVSLQEAITAYACNLVSSGHAIVLNSGAVALSKAIEARGLDVIGLTSHEISKGGGGYRCMTLTLDNRTPTNQHSHI